MYEEEVRLDARIHPRIIGAKGRGIARLMEKFEVELRFPRQDDPNSDPNVVTISGTEDNVLDCKEHLLNLEEEFVSSPFFPFKKSFFFFYRFSIITERGSPNLSLTDNTYLKQLQYSDLSNLKKILDSRVDLIGLRNL